MGTLAVVAAVLLLVSACGSSVGNIYSTTNLLANVTPVSPALVALQSTALPPDSTQKRLVIKDAKMAITADDPVRAMNSVTALAEQLGGWVVSSNLSDYRSSATTTEKRADVVIRVPAEQLEGALLRIRADASSIQSENQTGQDVTQQYTDLDSRRANLEAAEKQLRQFLENTKETKDTLAVYDQLVKVRGEIETIKGQLNYFQTVVAYSSITMTIYPTSKAVDNAAWNSGETLKSAVATLINVLRALADTLIWVLVVGLPFAAIALICVLVYRRVRPKISRRPPPALPPEPSVP